MSKKNVVVVVFLVIATLLISSCASTIQAFPLGKFRNRGQNSNYEFLENGTFNWGATSGATTFQAQYKIEGEVFTFLEGDAGTCPEEATYTWSFQDDVLLFELVNDPCTVRTFLMDGVEYFPVED